MTKTWVYRGWDESKALGGWDEVKTKTKADKWNLQTIGTPKVYLKDPHSHENTQLTHGNSSSYTSLIAISAVCVSVIMNVSKTLWR